MLPLDEIRVLHDFEALTFRLRGIGLADLVDQVAQANLIRTEGR